jgi:putative serine protease PepD
MRRISLALPVLAGAIAGAIAAVVIGTGSSTKTVTQTIVSTPVTAPAATAVPTSQSNNRSGMTINQIYRQDSPGVVDITVTSTTNAGVGSGFFGLGGQSQTQEDEGAGVVYNKQGDIITDEHVVAGIDPKIEVHFQDGLNAPATIVGTPDASTDVAVIHVNVPASQLHPIPFADSSKAQVGDPVVAIGSPFSLPETVTAGIVSAVGRAIQAPNGYTITGAIQTDAAINPGNSGGPLLDADGQVLGLNDQIQTSSGSSAGVGFATPGNTDVQVANEMIAGKKVQHAYVGLCIQNPLTGSGAQVATSSGQSCPSGPVVAGGPAARAGIRPGDIITAVNGIKISSSDDFVAVLSKYSPGQTVTFTVTVPGHGSTRRTIHVTLGNRPATAPTSG